MRILITGVAGFIGSNLAEFLLKEDHHIIGLDNFDPFYEKTIKLSNLTILANKNFTFYEGDVTDNVFLDNVFLSHHINIVIHLAAKAGVRPSLEDPQGYFDVNLNGTLQLLEAMKKVGLNKMIFASSSSVYGNNEKVPFSETDNVDFPISPYAASKKAAELLCHTYHHLYGFDIFCLRFFTVYGPRQRPDLAIHKFTKALIEAKEIPFYGDGSSKRDYTHISDIVAGISAVIENLNGYQIINLGESKTTTLKELIEYLEKYTDKKAILKQMPMQPGDVNTTFADISKAKTLLDYNPSTDIEEGLCDFVNWYKKASLNE